MNEQQQQIVDLGEIVRSSRDERARRDAVSELAKFGEAAILELRAALSNDHDGARIIAALELGFIGLPALPTLVEALESADHDVCWLAIRGFVDAGIDVLEPYGFHLIEREGVCAFTHSASGIVFAFNIAHKDYAMWRNNYYTCGDFYGSRIEFLMEFKKKARCKVFVAIVDDIVMGNI